MTRSSLRSGSLSAHDLYATRRTYELVSFILCRRKRNNIYIYTYNAYYPASDIFATGMTLIECTKRFTRIENQHETIWDVMEEIESIVESIETCSDLNSEVSGFLSKCLCEEERRISAKAALRHPLLCQAYLLLPMNDRNLQRFIKIPHMPPISQKLDAVMRKVFDKRQNSAKTN